MAKNRNTSPARGPASKPVSFKPLTPAEALTALLKVKPKDLAAAEAADDAQIPEDEFPVRLGRRK